MLEGIKAGDRVVNNLGEEATVVAFKIFSNGRCRLYLDTPITGWMMNTRKHLGLTREMVSS